MNTTPKKALKKLATSMSEVCHQFEGVAGNHNPHKDAIVVLVRSLQRHRKASAEMLAAEWAAQLPGCPVNKEAITMALELHRLFGAEWHIVCAHYQMRMHNEDFGEDDFIFYGDDLDDVRHMWSKRFESFDRKRGALNAAAPVAA